MPSPSGPRRHDLDALRAFAMLLGIVLHAALSFVPIPWIVHDRHQHWGFGVFVSGVHGFRMPLFFLLSGFFSAMLIARRGDVGMITQRVKRILLPLGLGVITIVPLMWVVAIWAGSTPTYGTHSQANDLWSVARRGDLERLERYLDGTTDLDALDPLAGQTALAWAVYGDQAEVAERLLAAGADPDRRMGDGGTALHGASFFGRALIVGHLLEADADVHRRNVHGETPLDTLGHDEETTRWVAGLLRIEIDWPAVERGREAVRPMLLARGASTGASGDGAAPGGATEDAAGQQLQAALMHVPFFHHLWFLWFVWWLAVLLLFVRAIANGLRIRSAPAWLMRAPVCWLWIVPLTWLPQSAMHMHGAMPGFGPDTSAGLVPMPHVLLYYGIFFGFGALYFSSDDKAGALGRWWWLQLPLALLVLLPLGLGLVFRVPEVLAVVPDGETRQVLADLCQVLFAWTMAFGLLGLFRRVLAADRPWVRYLSDSSYWLYLAHLPMIVWLQALVRNVDAPGLLKCLGITVVTTGVLLAVYAVAVRTTWIGRMLNGPRTR